MKQETGAAKLTMREVAARADVSLGTVSRVVNGFQSVKPALRTRVERAMEELGYEPNPLAQSLRTRSTRAVACIVSDINNPLFSQSVGAAEEVLHRSSYAMVLMNSHDEPAREADMIRLVRRRSMDGLITTMTQEHNREIGALLTSLKVPVVQLERDMPLPFDSVLSDHCDGAFRAAEYLLELGHKDIGLITVTTADWPGRERRRGFLLAHEKRGIPPNPEHMCFHGFSAEYGYRTALRFLSQSPRPTAIIAGANQLVGVLKAVRSLGLELPRDLSLISIGDSAVNQVFDPAITSIAWDVSLIGKTAAELLLRRLSGQGDDERRRIIFPVDLLVRGSCGPPLGSR